MLMMAHRKKTMNRMKNHDYIYFSILFLFYSQNSQLFFEKLLVKKKVALRVSSQSHSNVLELFFLLKKVVSFVRRLYNIHFLICFI